MIKMINGVRTYTWWRVHTPPTPPHPSIPFIEELPVVMEDEKHLFVLQPETGRMTPVLRNSLGYRCFASERTAKAYLLYRTERVMEELQPSISELEGSIAKITAELDDLPPAP